MITGTQETVDLPTLQSRIIIEKKPLKIKGLK